MAEQLYRKRIAPSAASNVDDIVSKNVLAQLRRDPPPRPAALDHPKPTGTSAPSGTGAGTASKGSAGGAPGAGVGVGVGGKAGGVEASDLIASMAKRLGALEREMKERQNLLQAVQADNAALKTKLKAAEEEIAKRAVAAIEPRDDSAAVMHLRSENARLRAQLKYAWKQVAEMKAFLNDYGMVWMGEPEAEAELAAQGYSSIGSRLPSASAGGPSTALQSLSPEPSDAMGPRRTSHSGAAPGPSSAAAAAAVAAAGTGKASGGQARGATASGMSAAASAALERAGEGGVGQVEAAGKRSGSFTAGATTATTAPSSGAATASAARPASSPRGAAGPSAAAASPRAAPLVGSLPVSMAELQAKVEELNDLAGDGCGQVVRDAGGQHVLAMRDPVNLVVYRDGLQIHTLPAKPFGDPASAAILRDILDGYFPYVLKRDFPDGVPLRVMDRTSESIASLTGRHGGAGGAAANGGGAVASSRGNIRTFGDIDGNTAAGEPVSRDKFLSRLPQAVIKNGKVIEIRSDISRMLGGPGGGGGGAAGDGSKPDVALVATPVDALLSTVQRNHTGPTLPPPSREGLPPATEVTTLQVKSVDGKQTYILKLKYDDTIGNLRTCIGAHHAKAGQAGANYEIRSAFPARTYTDDSETLRQAGLVPNATLFLRAL